MATRTPEEIAIQAWVAAETGIETIFSDQKGARPIPLPYASVLELTDAMVGGQLEREYQTDGLDALERVSSRRQGIFSVQIYGDNHTALARSLLLSTYDNEVIRTNEAAGITVAYASTPPTRLSRDSDGVTEDRTLTEYAVRFVIARERAITDLIEDMTLTDTTGP